MTDGQPGQNQAGAAAEGNAQDTGFNVTFDEGNAGQQGTNGGNADYSEGANNGGGEGILTPEQLILLLGYQKTTEKNLEMIQL